MSANKRIPTNVITYNGVNCIAFWGLGDTAVQITYAEYLDYISTSIGYTFQETESRRVANKRNGEHIDFIVTEPDKWYKVIDKFEMTQEEPTHEWIICFEETSAPEPEKGKTPFAPEFDSLYTVLKAIAEQIGIVRDKYDSKFDVAKAIYDKLYKDDGYSVEPIYVEDSTYGIVGNILNIAINGAIGPSALPNKLTFDGSEFVFERTPEVGEYVTGDLYVNSNKVGTYQGFTTENTISNWEEASLAITSQSFGNQAVSLIKEKDGEWRLK